MNVMSYGQVWGSGLGGFGRRGDADSRVAGATVKAAGTSRLFKLVGGDDDAA
jgi:hypothetical protein